MNLSVLTEWSKGAKHMFIRVNLVVIAMLALAAIFGCGDDDKGTNRNGDKIPSELVGTWKFQSATIDGDTVGMELIAYLFQWGPTTVSARMRISGDGSFVYEELDSDGNVPAADTGTFSVNGNSFSVDIDIPNFTGGTWSVSGNQLTLNVNIVGYEVEITATRIEP
jgi:hypothetical protein